VLEPAPRVQAPAEPIIPLPEIVPAPKAREIAPDAESLLGAVLDALPEPKKPGQGRARSRRVSTPALTPGVTGIDQN
jgi:ribonuclease E